MAKIKDISATRQIERVTAIMQFKKILKPLWVCLLKVETWDDVEVAKDAYSLRTAIESMDFLVALASLEDILTHISPYVKRIQKKEWDIVSALNSLQKMSDQLVEKKDPFKFTTLVSNAIELANSLSLENNVFRGFRVSAASEVNYKKLYFKLIDDLVNDLNSRLTKREFLSGQIVKLLPHECPNDEEIKEIVEFYLPHLGVQSTDEAVTHVKSERKFLEGLVEANCSIENCIEELPNGPLRTLFKILALTSVSNSSAERSFSKLKITKTYLRNKLGSNNLSNQCTISINKSIKVDSASVVDDFINDVIRRIDLS